MSDKRFIKTFENAKLRIVPASELAQLLAEQAVGGSSEIFITKADALEIELLYERFRRDVNPAKWARIVKGGQFLQLGQYVGAISTSNLNILISPKVDEAGTSGLQNVEGCVDLSVLVRSARTLNLPTEEYSVPGVMDLEIFFLHSDRFINDLANVISFGLRCGYVATKEDLKSLRGLLDTDRLPLSMAVKPELLPCKFEEFEENTLHNQILKRALVIIRDRLRLPRCITDPRAAPLVRLCGELIELLIRVSDVKLEWADVAGVQLSNLESRYNDIFHYAKLLIKCAAPADFDVHSTAGNSPFMSGFSQVWDAAILYERHIANYLELELSKAQKRKPRFSIRTQKEGARPLVKGLSDDLGYYQILPDIIIWDNREDRAHLIIDTKWKKYDGSMSDARQADAYQVHAYATTYSVPYKTKSGLNKTYFPPVCLLYPTIGEAVLPVKGKFVGTNSLFILASAPMNQKHFEFDPAVVLGDCWPV